MSKTGTILDTIEVDFFESQIDAASGEATLGVIFSINEPIVTREIPPTQSGENPQLVTRLTFEVLSTAKPGEYEINFAEQLFDPAIANLLTHQGNTIDPQVNDGTFAAVIVTESSEPGDALAAAAPAPPP